MKKPKSFLVRKIRETNKPLLFATANVFLSEFNTEKHLTINNLAGKNIFTVSALGDKAGFELAVKLTGGLICGQISFPDHHEYNQHEWDEVESQAKETKSEYIITHWWQPQDLLVYNNLKVLHKREKTPEHVDRRHLRFAIDKHKLF